MMNPWWDRGSGWVGSLPSTGAIFGGGFRGVSLKKPPDIREGLDDFIDDFLVEGTEFLTPTFHLGDGHPLYFNLFEYFGTTEVPVVQPIINEPVIVVIILGDHGVIVHSKNMNMVLVMLKVVRPSVTGDHTINLGGITEKSRGFFGHFTEPRLVHIFGFFHPTTEITKSGATIIIRFTAE